MTVSLFEIPYKKSDVFHDILIFWDAPVFACLLLVKQKERQSVQDLDIGNI